ncbi:hypothetical protein RRG08_004791 [Elysia crispata]|uniref:Uncharacterized protein n=1 Tax=Elysia crispata TaxID=231223 RepID=A0AAE1B9Q6_9GAST|nr:hypothetical protein RRG08_004791 [Elysia crispata]
MAARTAFSKVRSTWAERGKAVQAGGNHCSSRQPRIDHYFLQIKYSSIQIVQFHSDCTVPLRLDSSTQIGQFHSDWTVPLSLDSSTQIVQFHSDWTVPLRLDSSTQTVQFHSDWTVPLRLYSSTQIGRDEA